MTVPASDSELLIAAVADVQETSLPLATGLRMLAADLPRQHWGQALRALAEEVERGVPLAAALETPQVAKLLPAPLRGLLSAASARGDLPNAASELMEIYRLAREERGAFFRALAYPLVITILSTVVCVLFAWMLTTYIQPMIQEFGLRTSGYLTSVYAAAHYITLTAAYGVPAALLFAGAIRFFGGRSVADGLWCEAPLMGPVLLWSSTAELLRATAVYLEQQTPLPLALQWSADSQSNYLIAQEGRTAARAVEQGMSFAEAWKRSLVLPQSITPLLAKDGVAPDARTLRIAAELLSVRVTQRAAVLTTILPPLAFVFVATMLVAVVAATLAPMIALIQGLSGGFY